jgi:5-deoxy-glucuronate isomerase
VVLRSHKSDLLTRGTNTEHGIVVQHLLGDSDMRYVGFRAVRLTAGADHSGHTGTDEVALVVISGTVTVHCGVETWTSVGERSDPFSGSPYTIYLPPNVRYDISAEISAEIGICAAPAREQYPPRLITPGDVPTHDRGIGQAKRTINNILMEDASAGSLLITEVQSPAGNWSSYPPHKHDQDNLPVESLLEETYYFRIRPPRGFAFQRIYTADQSLDETITVHDGDLVLVPRGYHVVAAAAEYQVYYPNVLAGPHRALRMRFDPDHEWIMEGWKW